MLLNLNNNPKKLLIWVIIHIAIGVLSTFSNIVLVAWLYLVVLWFLFNILSRGANRELYLIAMICYIGSFDVIGRMARASPLIPYELSKYMLPPLLILGLIISRKQWNRGFSMLVLILPAFLYDVSGMVTSDNLIFYGLGPVTLSLSVAYFYGKKLSLDSIMICLRMFFYTSLMVLAFAFFKTPSYDKIEFSLRANFETTGGFGSNQVANVLGLGAFVMFLKLMMNKTVSGNRFIDIGILGMFLLQSLLTFSRGGMFSAFAGAIAFVLFFPKFTARSLGVKINRGRLTALLIAIGIFGYGIFLYVDNITGNKLSLRYSGETYTTQIGAEQKNISTFTTTRYDIMLSEFAMWNDNILIGTGMGASQHLRPKYYTSSISSHTEFSRLLAEHGIPGLLFLVVWLSIYLVISYKNSGINKALLISMFAMSFFTSTHSAMRVFITPLFAGLATTVITDRRNHPVLKNGVIKIVQ